ncbi:AAA family ATPase [bacterium]|nr:AAA family ATPase [bacterium]
MGIYVNPGNENLKIALNSKIFVDKSLFIKQLCEFINTDYRFICVSRPRRFGKTRIGSPRMCD